MFWIRLTLLLTLAATGCQLSQKKQQAMYVEPKISMAMTRDELIEYLNSQSEGLKSWRCSDTVVEASLPRLPDQKLKGNFACSWPSHFKLDSSNFIVQANLGSNSDICWAYFQPGDPVVMTWKHEDAYLLQYLPDGIPRLEPDWLMTILGIQPLDRTQYQLTNAPAGSRELWLTAIENAPDGSSLRRVIKVDSVSGVAREHALYDANRNLVLRAQLKDHKTCANYRLPHTVVIEFPSNKTRLTLKFNGIQADCQLPEELWQPPRSQSMQYVDAGDFVRQRYGITGEQLERSGSIIHQTGDERFYGFDEDEPIALVTPDPEFDDSSMEKTRMSADRSGSVPIPDFDMEASTKPAPKKRWFSAPFGRRK